MYQGKYVFTQLCEFLPKSSFDYLVDKYEGNKYIKSFTCWNHLLVLIFGQLTYRESLRDLVSTLNAHQEKFHHLGFGKSVTRSNLSKTNEIRSVEIFEDFTRKVIAIARQKKAEVADFFIENDLYAFDSSTISFCLKPFWWAYPYNEGKGGIKLHTLYDVKRQIPVLNMITDYSPEQKNTYVFLTNNMELKAEEIALIYKYRWNIEVFFKWIKQHLRIKEFYGTSENAVKIQIYSAIIAYCIVAIAEKESQLKISTYEVLRILSVGLLEKKPFRELFEKAEAGCQIDTQLSINFF